MIVLENQITISVLRYEVCIYIQHAVIAFDQNCGVSWTRTCQFLLQFNPFNLNIYHVKLESCFNITLQNFTLIEKEFCGNAFRIYSNFIRHFPDGLLNYIFSVLEDQRKMLMQSMRHGIVLFLFLHESQLPKLLSK